MSPSHDPDALSSARLELDGESCENGRWYVEDGRSRQRASIPADAREVFSLDLDAKVFARDERPFPSLAGLVLDIATDPGRCLGRSLDIRPFTESATVLPEGFVLAGVARTDPAQRQFLRLVRPTPDRVVAMTQSAVLVIDRHLGFVDDDFRRPLVATLPRESVAEGWWTPRDLVLDPTSSPEAPRVVLAASIQNSGGTIAGGVFVLTLGPQGFAAVETATITLGHSARDVLVDGQGRLVAVGTSGTVITASSVRGPFRTQFVPGISGSLEVLSETGWPSEPHVTASFEGTFLFGDAFAGSFRASDAPTLATVTALANRAVGSKNEVWATTFRSVLHRADGDESWTEVSVNLPTNATRCSDGADACGLVGLGNKNAPRNLVPTRRGSFVFGAKRCTALLELDPETGCTNGLLFEGEVAEFVENEGFQAIFAAEDGTLILGGADGLLLEATVPD